MKKILFVASEAVPFIKTGGLADVVGALPKCFDKNEYDVRVIIPKYMCMKEEYKNQLQYVTHFYMDIGYRREYVGIMQMVYEGIQYYFIDNEYYFSGYQPYGDIRFDIEKFSYFSKAALSILPVIDFRPDLIHCYAEEIKTEFYGEKLDGLMRARANDLRGIVNGIDYDEWNPETDQLIAKNYNAKTFRKEKVKNKIELQRELGLNQDPKAMMIGIVSRLTDQKGFDLIAYVMDELCQDNIQLVVLGTGEEQYENMFRHFAWKYQGKVSANIFYDNAMSHKIYASCDAFLMPSLFEPCGLSQLMSLRYGTIPIVRETGGLKDTVEPYNEYESTGTGFSFTNYNAHEMLATVRYAEAVYYDRKREWNKLIDRAMAKDFSWGNSAKQYEEMYNWLIG